MTERMEDVPMIKATADDGDDDDDDDDDDDMMMMMMMMMMMSMRMRMRMMMRMMMRMRIVLTTNPDHDGYIRGVSRIGYADKNSTIMRHGSLASQ